MGDAQHRLFLRRARGAGGSSGAGNPSPSEQEVAGLDAVVVPALLLFVARDLALRDPPRVLAWRLLHDERLAGLSHLSALLPRPSADLDRDPLALVLATVATLLAALYLGGALFGRGTRFRAGVLAVAALTLVVLPTSAFITMGYVTGRPYGQDGGVVQLPLAMDKIVEGQSPYDTDYTNTILAKQAGVSRMWSARPGGPTYGENPLLHHHAYLPGTHMLMLPFHLAARAAGTTFDPRVLTLAAYFAAALLAAYLCPTASSSLIGAALVLVNPLVYWHQIFGANDIIFVALLLGAMLALERRPTAGAVLLGLACATKQLAWPVAPFLIVAAAGSWSFPRAAGRRALRMTATATAVFLAMVLPIAALDFRAFYVDIFGYNVGLPGVTNYPLGGTPGFGVANLVIYLGAVKSLGEYFPFGIFYLLIVPVVLWLLRAALRRHDITEALGLGCGALLLTLYFSRLVHANYLIPLATLLPIAALAGGALALDTVVVPLALLATAVEIADRSPLKLLWDDAVAARFPQYASGFVRHLLPRCGPELTDDPLTLVWSAAAAGWAAVYLVAALLGAPRRVRTALAVLALVVVALVPLFVVVSLGEKTVVRAQDEWVVEVRAAAESLTGHGAQATGTWAREAVPTSFRDEPARRLEAEHWPIPAGPALLQALLRVVGAARDPRLLSLLAAFALVGIISASVPPAQRSALLGVLLLVPAAVDTIVFGGVSVLALCVLALAIAASVPSPLRPLGWALAGAFSLPATLAAFLQAGTETGRARLRAALALGIGLLLGWAPLAVSARVRGAFAVGPGLGLANLWLYFGQTPPAIVFAVLWLVPVVAGLTFLPALRRGEVPVGAAMAWVVLLAILVAPLTAPDAVLLPVGLLALAAAGV